MAVIENNFKLKDSHWYTPKGEPCYEIEKVKGGMRPTTLRDARKLGLLPSVTTVFNIMAKPGLDQWKINKAIQAAKEVQQGEDESDDYYLKRVVEASRREVKEAAELGTKIHDAIEHAIDGASVASDLAVYVDPVLKILKEKGFQTTMQEETCVNRVHGYAGRVDFIGIKSGQRFVIDFKTRKTKAGEVLKPYEFQPMQIAAYAVAHFGNLKDCYGANIYISTTEPGRVESITYDAERLQEEFDAFVSMLNLWRYLNGYDPRIK